MNEFDITVSIVIYNTDFDEVNNVIGKFKNLNLKYLIFIIDNSPFSSEDKYGNLLNVKYSYTNKNLGFGSGHNIAINDVKFKSKFHLILNSDVDFETESIKIMYEYALKNPEVGLLGPKIVYPDGSIQYSCKMLPTPLNLIIRRFFPIKRVQIFLDHTYELRFSDFNKIIDVPQIMGCFMFINCKVFENVEGFDERFFMYLEDVDFSRRIHSKYRTIFFPDVTIMHKHSRGSYSNLKLLSYHIMSTVKYFNKWGWFFDKPRIAINKRTLAQFGKNKDI